MAGDSKFQVGCPTFGQPFYIGYRLIDEAGKSDMTHPEIMQTLGIFVFLSLFCGAAMWLTYNCIKEDEKKREAEKRKSRRVKLPQRKRCSHPRMGCRRGR
jgi:hypothetical protein